MSSVPIAPPPASSHTYVSNNTGPAQAETPSKAKGGGGHHAVVSDSVHRGSHLPHSSASTPVAPAGLSAQVKDPPPSSGHHGGGGHAAPVSKGATAIGGASGAGAAAKTLLGKSPGKLAEAAKAKKTPPKRKMVTAIGEDGKGQQQQDEGEEDEALDQASDEDRSP